MVWHNCFEQTTGMLTEDIQWLRCVLCWQWIIYEGDGMMVQRKKQKISKDTIAPIQVSQGEGLGW
jgi:hypothetical protein